MVKLDHELANAFGSPPRSIATTSPTHAHTRTHAYSLASHRSVCSCRWGTQSGRWFCSTASCGCGVSPVFTTKLNVVLAASSSAASAAAAADCRLFTYAHPRVWNCSPPYSPHMCALSIICHQTCLCPLVRVAVVGEENKHQAPSTLHEFLWVAVM